METAESAYPPGEGVTVSGEKLTVTPEGWPLGVSVTGDENSLIEVIVTIADVEPPGEAETV
jgi:chitodextrinase